jgi:hypothetical protein
MMEVKTMPSFKIQEGEMESPKTKRTVNGNRITPKTWIDVITKVRYPCTFLGELKIKPEVRINRVLVNNPIIMAKLIKRIVNPVF